MKKIIFAVLTVLFSMCMLIPLAASAVTLEDVNEGTKMDYDIWNYINNDLMPAIENNSGGASQESVDNLQHSVDSINVKKDMDEYFNEKTNDNKETIKGYPKTAMDALIKALNTCWSSVPELIRGSDSGVWKITLDPSKQTAFTGIFKTLGYSLVLLFFAANLIENTIKFEIFTLKGGTILCGRLLISKVFIDLSVTICTYILNICNNVSTKLLDSAVNKIEFSTPNIENKSIGALGILGTVIDYYQAYVMIIPVLVIMLIMIIAAAFIIFKLVCRSLELSLLMIVSPAFFACYSSELTKPYFKNFITTFLQCALQIVFMSVVFALSANWITDITATDSTIEAWAWFAKVLPNALIALAFAIMMVKPPKVLTGLIK